MKRIVVLKILFVLFYTQCGKEPERIVPQSAGKPSLPLEFHTEVMALDNKRVTMKISVKVQVAAASVHMRIREISPYTLISQARDVSATALQPGSVVDMVLILGKNTNELPELIADIRLTTPFGEQTSAFPVIIRERNGSKTPAPETGQKRIKDLQ